MEVNPLDGVVSSAWMLAVDCRRMHNYDIEGRLHGMWCGGVE